MVETNLNYLLRKLPAVHLLISSEKGKELINEHGRSMFVETCNQVLNDYRKQIIKNEGRFFSQEDILNKISELLKEKKNLNLKRVVNGTGIILHTNLGRAVLGKDVVEAVCETAGSYTNLEYDLNTGKRGSRYTHVKELLQHLTGAEDAIVVNNNAAAVLLIMNTFAAGKEAIVSRGELVEIGGSFRIPEVLKLGNVKLVEVGTTNKTKLTDYQDALNENTALILKVHTSNYKIIGFTHVTTREELVELAGKNEIPFVEDLGSGAFLDFSSFGITGEPIIADVIKKGVDVVTFSGDKLLGGPQSGIIVGKKIYIDQLKKNQLTRALRIDKLTIAALEATLRTYRMPEKIKDSIPIYKMLSYTQEELKTKADRIYNRLLPKSHSMDINIIPTQAQMGGGSLPGQAFPSWGIALVFNNMPILIAEERLRKQEIPILGYIEKDMLIFDVRTLQEGDEEILINGIKNLSL